MNGFTKVPHLLFEGGFSVWEREMMIYLLDCENRLQKEGKWFGVIDDDFINIGFGKDKRILRETRDSLIAKGQIQYKKGGPGHKSQYMVMLKSEIKSVTSSEPKKNENETPKKEIVIIKETIKKEENDYDKWLTALINEDPNYGSSRQIIFEQGWRKYFGNRYDAVDEVTDVLKANKINVSLSRR